MRDPRARQIASVAASAAVEMLRGCRDEKLRNPETEKLADREVEASGNT